MKLIFTTIMLTLSIGFSGCEEKLKIDELPLIEKSQASNISAQSKELKEIFTYGSDYTDIQRENKEKELKGKIIQWKLPIYEISKRDENIYRIQTSGGKSIGTYIILYTQNIKEQHFVENLKTKDEIYIKGKINPAILVHKKINNTTKLIPHLDSKIKKESNIQVKLDRNILLLNDADFNAKILRNVPYAKRGYIFKNKALMKFYKSQKWYKENPSYIAKSSDLKNFEKEWLKRMLKYTIDKGTLISQVEWYQELYYDSIEKPIFEKKYEKEIFNYLVLKGISAQQVTQVPYNGTKVVWESLVFELRDIDTIFKKNPKLYKSLKESSKIFISFEEYNDGNAITLIFS